MRINGSYKARTMKIIPLVMVMFILLILSISSVSAVTTTKQVINIPRKKYPDIAIFEDGFEKVRLKLTYNTDDCGCQCSATIKITNQQEFQLPSAKNGSYYGFTLKDMADKTKEKAPKSYQTKYADKNKTVLATVGYTCMEYIAQNGTATTNCTIPVTQSISIPDYKTLVDGDKIVAGTSYIELNGEKGLFDNIDWVITLKGITTDEWANWSSSSLGYNITAYFSFNATTGSNSVVNDVNGSNNMTLDEIVD